MYKDKISTMRKHNPLGSYLVQSPTLDDWARSVHFFYAGENPFDHQNRLYWGIMRPAYMKAM